jgi:hypothetical protein
MREQIDGSTGLARQNSNLPHDTDWPAYVAKLTVSPKGSDLNSGQPPQLVADVTLAVLSRKQQRAITGDQQGKCEDRDQAAEHERVHEPACTRAS